MYVQLPVKRAFLALLIACWSLVALAPAAVRANEKYASMVIDARSGEVLHARNADKRLHPASLTKMMTLYVVFEAVENGEIGLDDMVTISRTAAAEPPSKLGLRAGQRIKLRYLIRAAAIKSANDAATALGEAIEGSEAAFARRMNRTAKALGMTRTTFRNAHGLTESGHLSTARDMTTLGRALFFHFPDYYNIFSRTSEDAGIRQVRNTNRRLLSDYRGADGIKTGYTRAAGFNLVASAEHGNKRVIATVFGGRSSATRNAHVAELLDLGFGKAPSRVASLAPPRPSYGGTRTQIALAPPPPPPLPRPATRAPLPEPLVAALREEVAEAVAQTALVAALGAVQESAAAGPAAAALPDAPAPLPRPASLQQVAMVHGAPAGGEIVARVSSSGGRHWAIDVGLFGSRYQAERMLLQTALREVGMLDSALRKVVESPRGYRANFVGLTQEEAALACRRLSAGGSDCRAFGPQS